MCLCSLTQVTSTRQCGSFIRLSKSMECLLEVYLQMKVKGLPKIDGPRMPHILLDIVFLIDSMLLAKVDICTNENLYWRNWLCKRITHIFLLIIILKINSFWREFWVERVTALWLKANWWTFCHWWRLCAKKVNS